MKLIELHSDSDSNNFDIYEIDETPLEEEAQREYDEVPEGSLATLSGLNQFCTIKVPGRAFDEKVIVLIDGGATYNFVDKKFATRKNFLQLSFLVSVLLLAMVILSHTTKW